MADIDLVNTTPPQLLGTEEAQQLPPSTKRARVNNAAATAQDTLTANKSKQAKIKRAERQQELVAQSIHWRAKYKAAFPTFTFYFDALDAATEHTVIKAVERLGAVSCCRPAARLSALIQLFWRTGTRLTAGPHSHASFNLS